MVLKGKVACNIYGAIRGFAWNNEKDKCEPSSSYILIVKETNTDMLELILNSNAVITEVGGLLCHAAVVCREFNIPCIVGANNVTKLISTGDDIYADFESGEITVYKDA